MSFSLILSNLTNPTLLFFLLGIFAASIKSDLEIPAPTIKFISLYLLFSIGFKGGQELQHSTFSAEIIYSILFGLLIATLIPLYCFYILKRKLSISDAAAIAACYGSVSAITFVSAVTFLEMQSLHSDGHMIAVMALMEFPAIVVGVMLIRKFDKSEEPTASISKVIKHAFSNASVIMVLGSLIIGMISDSKQAEGIKPFTTDIFKGFLAIFLLEMGMVTSKRFKAFRERGISIILFALIIPLINGIVVAYASHFITESIANRFIFSILAASASYIAVPAAMRFAAPNADPGLYIPMALGLTFPLNITIGMPIYFYIIQII
ncbi:sodium-dependent bicarbonate transport family permease [Bacteroidota bacterium]|nr:sodium-dependent bicarbonate transport family permease [Bacteroidota bacterium]